MLMLEQPAGVTQTTSPTAQPSCRAIWKGWRPIILVLLMCSLLLVEMVVYQSWLADELWTLKGLLLVVLAVAAPFLAMFLELVLTYLLARLPLRITKPSKRTLRLDEKGARLSQTKYNRFLWKQVRRWLLAPVPDQAGLVTLTLEAGSQSRRRYWSIVLDERGQKHAFLSELEQLRQMSKTDAPMVVLSQPLPPRRPVRKGLLPLVVGCYLLIHGLPLMAVGLMPLDEKRERSDYELTPAQKAKLERTMRRVFQRLHISNTSQFRAMFLIPGAALTTAGIGVAIWGNRRQRVAAAELYRLYDLELEGMTLKSH